MERKNTFVVRPFDCNSLPTRKKGGTGVGVVFVLSRAGSQIRTVLNQQCAVETVLAALLLVVLVHATSTKCS